MVSFIDITCRIFELIHKLFRVLHFGSLSHGYPRLTRECQPSLHTGLFRNDLEDAYQSLSHCHLRNSLWYDDFLKVLMIVGKTTFNGGPGSALFVSIETSH